MDRNLVSRSVHGLVGETARGSALFRAIVGTITAALVVWRLELPWEVLVILCLVVMVYVLARRVLRLERLLRTAEAEPADHVEDPAAVRRRVRDELSDFAAKIKTLNERARAAFDGGYATWEAWDAEAKELLRAAAAAVQQHLGEHEHREFTQEPYGLRHCAQGQTDAKYVIATTLLGHRQGQLEEWVRKIPAL